MQTGSPSRRQFLQSAAALAIAIQVPAQPTASTNKLRGLMVDAARTPESLAYNRRVLDFCSDWELNTLQFRLTDDQGSALRFASVPDLITHPDAFTPDELHDLVEYGRKRGVELLPEVEAFGHTGYITRSPAYKHLLDDDPRGTAEFTGIIPVHPETPQVFEKLFREVAGIFPSQYLHGGCDEVNWGGSELSRKALETKSRTEIWGEHLNMLNGIAHRLNKQFIVWGDMVLHKEPAILARLDKSIVIMDWNYWDTGAIQFHDALETVRANGSRAIGGAGLISYRWGPRPGTEQLRNIDAFADAYLGSNDPASLGVVLTNWVPSRYIQNSLWDGFAYAAVAFKDGSGAARTQGFRRFVERHFGGVWNAAWSEAIDLLYAAAPLYGDAEKETPLGLRLPVPFSDDEMLAAAFKKPQQANPFSQLRGQLDSLASSVRKNIEDFQALTLSVQYLDALFARENAIRQHPAKPFDSQSAHAMIAEIASRDRTLLDALEKDWSTGRSPQSLAEVGPLYGMAPKDQLLWQWQRATAYSAALARDPNRFLKLVQARSA